MTVFGSFLYYVCCTFLLEALLAIINSTCRTALGGAAWKCSKTIRFNVAVSFGRLQLESLVSAMKDGVVLNIPSNKGDTRKFVLRPGPGNNSRQSHLLLVQSFVLIVADIDIL